MKKIELNGNELTVVDGEIKKFQLDNLRIVFLFLPGEYSYYVVYSSQNIHFVNIDLLVEEKLEMLSDIIQTAEKSRSGLSTFKFYLGNYSGQTTLITLKELISCGISIFPLLVASKNKRATAREKWIDSEPNLTLNGGFGAKMTLTFEGINFKSKFIQWDNISKYEVEENHFGLSHLLIIPKGVDDGIFSFSKYKYRLSNIPTKKYPMYLAECEFWNNLKGTGGHRDLVSKLKKLVELRDNGILTNERFEESKQKLLGA